MAIAIAQCFTDVSGAVHNCHRRLDGIGRVQIEAARALAADGGRMFWMAGALYRPYEIGKVELADLREATDRPERGRIWSFGQKRLRSVQNFWNLRNRPLSFERGDLVLLFGAYWSRRSLRAIRGLAINKGVKIVTFLHDLLPVRRPELSWQAPEARHLFREYLRTIGRLSDRVITNSEFTRGDFLRFCQEERLPLPATGVVRLASDLDILVTPNITPRLAREGLTERGFAVMVSTFEPRKNHWFAYQLWREFVARHGQRTLPLVFVGEPGWQMNHAFEAMKRDSRMWGTHIRLAQGASDQELAWLYSNAVLTLYPSDYEGWGLPITESLAFGTHCLAADNTSLREASQGLAWHADTLDGRAWLGEVERCISDTAYLNSKRTEIRARFIKRRWKDFAADLLDEIGLVGSGSKRLDKNMIFRDERVTS